MKTTYLVELRDRKSKAVSKSFEIVDCSHRRSKDRIDGRVE